MTLGATEEARLSDLDRAVADEALEAATPAELFSVVDALDKQSALKRALTDPATDAAVRQQLAERLLEGKVSGQAIHIVKQAVAQRWNSGRGLADALERQAVLGLFRQARDGGQLDEVQGQLFGFLRTVEESAELREAVSDRSKPLQARQQLVRQLLQFKANGVVEDLAIRAVGARKRTFARTVESYLTLAAQVRGRDIARVTVARPLDVDQAERMRAALSRIHGRDVELQVSVDPQVIGGVRVELGDEVFEGTISERLDQVHRALV